MEPPLQAPKTELSDSPCSEKKVPLRLTDLPGEIQREILKRLCAPERRTSHDGSPGPWHWYGSNEYLPNKFGLEGVNAFYTKTKKLIFDFAEFRWEEENRHLRSSQIDWPCLVHIHDSENDLAVGVIPTTGPKDDLLELKSSGNISQRELECCPLENFAGIVIKMPRHHNRRGLVVNWGRLRALSKSLEKMNPWHGNSMLLDIVFEDTETWSWMEDDGTPKTNRQLSRKLLKEGDEAPASDLLVLLRALRSLKGGPKITVKTPSNFPKSELERPYSANWLMYCEHEEFVDFVPGKTYRGTSDTEMGIWIRHTDGIMVRYLRKWAWMSRMPYRPPHRGKCQLMHYSSEPCRNCDGIISSN